MPNENGWPDASKPGVPLNPEKDGPHLFRNTAGRLVAANWLAGPPDRQGNWSGLVGNSLTWGTPKDMAKLGMSYLGPCLTPSEVQHHTRAAAAIRARRGRRGMSHDPKMVEMVARAMREAWRGQENLRADTLDWPDIEDDERAECMGSATAALDALAAAGRLVPGWQSIATAPRDGTVIDLWFAGRWNQRMTDAYWSDNLGAWVIEARGCSYLDSPTITHWKPLPAAPETHDE